MSVPEPTGPFKVSVADHEQGNTDYPVLVRLYYPCRFKAGTEPDAMCAEDASNITAPYPVYWLPSWRYAQGYGSFVKMPAFFGVPAVLSTLGRVLMPVVPDFPLVAAQEVTAGRDAGVSSAPDTLPVMVFSHGLGGMRTTYSYFCTDMASHGWVVAAIEHRDGSASMALTTDQGRVPYQRPQPDQDQFNFRNSQIKHRIQEVAQTIKLLESLNRGDSVPCVLQDASHGIKLTQQTSFQNRLDFSRLVMAGHSFGSATTLAVVHEVKRFKCAIAMDTWCFPLDKGLDALPLPVPTCFINTERFTWAENDESIASLVKASRENTTTRGLADVPYALKVVVKGTRHQNQSDMPLLLPHWILRHIPFMAGPADPLRSIQVNNSAAMAFLQAHVPAKTGREGENTAVGCELLSGGVGEVKGTPELTIEL